MPIFNQHNVLVNAAWPFHPLQSGVDIFSNRLTGGVAAAIWRLPTLGTPIESMDSDAIAYFVSEEVNYAFLKFGNVFNISLANQALDTATVDAVLEELAAFAAGNPTATPTVLLNGGTNSTPTKASVGSVTITNGGTLYVTGQSLIFTGANTTPAVGTIHATAGVIDSIVLTDHGTGYSAAPTVTVNTVAGIGAILVAVMKNTDQITLETAGWTVTVN